MSAIVCYCINPYPSLYCAVLFLLFLVMLGSKKTSHNFFSSIKSTLILAFIIKFKIYLQICITTLLYNVQTPYCYKSWARICKRLKGQCQEIFCFWFFFMNQFPPKPLSIPLGQFRIFPKIRRDIRSSRLTTGSNDTGGKFATGINDTGGKFCHQFH